MLGAAVGVSGISRVVSLYVSAVRKSLCTRKCNHLKSLHKRRNVKLQNTDAKLRTCEGPPTLLLLCPHEMVSPDRQNLWAAWSRGYR